MNKASLRLDLISQRKALSHQQRFQMGQKVCQQILDWPPFQQAQHIAIYLPVNGETDISSLLQQADKNLYLPSVHGQDMQFQPHQPGQVLVCNQFGIKQPRFKPEHPRPSLDLCLTPLLGFDQKGNRLGMGGGYYDRYFAHNEHTLLVGVAYQFQQLQQLPADPWDVKLQHIITEQGIITT